MILFGCLWQKGRVLYVSEYGADPSGNEESGDAILRAVEDAFGLQKDYEMVAGVNDLGGVVIDLEGGNYKISKPITFPSGTGNVVVSIYLSMPQIYVVCSSGSLFLCMFDWNDSVFFFSWKIVTFHIAFGVIV